MEYIKIPEKEYKEMKEQLALLSDNEFIKKMNRLIDLIYEKKYGLYLGDYTEDLTEASIDNVKEWHESGDEWNDV